MADNSSNIFSCSPLLRDAVAPSLLASLARGNDHGLPGGSGEQEQYGHTSGGSMQAQAMESNERSYIGGNDETSPAFTASPFIQTPNFPLPSVLGDQVRDPATFGLTLSPSTPVYGFAGGTGNGNSNGSSAPALPPLRVSDRFSSLFDHYSPDTNTSNGNPTSSLSVTAGMGMGVNGNAAAYLFAAHSQPPVPPPPHTMPVGTSTSYSLSTASSSDQLYTPTSTSSGASGLLPTPSSTGCVFGQNNDTLPPLPGLGNPLAPPTQQQQPTTMVPTAMQQWPEHHPRSRQPYPYLDPDYGGGLGLGLGIRSSTSSLSLGQLSVSPYSRATSMESEAHPVPPKTDYGTQPRMDIVERQWPQDDKYAAVRRGNGVPTSAPEISYTDDAEVKTSERIKRECHNCSTHNPPSWRKSQLTVGKILCNKCGIYERTHNRPRPAQADDLKLRKTNDSNPHGQHHVHPQPMPPMHVLPPGTSTSASVSINMDLSPDTSFSSISDGPDVDTRRFSSAGHTPLSVTFPTHSPAPAPSPGPGDLPSVRSTFWTHHSPPTSPTSHTGRGDGQPVYGFTSSNTRSQVYSPYARPTGSGSTGRRSR